MVKRIEIFANTTVQDEIIEALESQIPDLYYSLVPVVHGKGRQKWRLGTTFWPDENFLLISYVDESFIPKIKEIIQLNKEKFPTEGIKFFELSVS